MTSRHGYYKIGIIQSSGDWIIEFYFDEAGASPVLRFLAGLDDKTKYRISWSLEQLRVRNIRARVPLAPHLEGKLWELREESNTNIYRIIYFFFTGRRIVLLHAFEKKTQKTPRSEITIAQQRLETFLSREQ